MKTIDGNTLMDYAQQLQIQLTTPTTRIVLVGPHILFIDTASGQVLDVRKRKALNTLLRDRGFMKANLQVTDALHYAFVGTIEGDGEYLEANLLERGMLDEYRQLLSAMSSKRNTGKFILQFIALHGIHALSPEGDPEVELKEWMIDLPIDIEQRFQSFEPYEPKVD